MKRIGIIVLLVIVVSGIIGFVMWNKPHRKAENEQGIAVTAPELYKAYTRNEQEANERFLNKVVRVRGQVLSQEKNQDGQLVAILAAQPGTDELIPSGVMCTMREQGVSLAEGQEVVLKGFSSGYTGDVHLSDCIVAP